MSNSNPHASDLSLSPVIRMALGDLDALLAPGGNLRPEDRPLAMGLLAVLHDHREAFTPEQVRAWVATRPGGNPALADDLAAVARDVIDGRDLHLASRWWNEKSVERWRYESGCAV